jgi:long-chain fatty acid transport protein
MKRSSIILAMALLAIIVWSSSAFATNGDNMIGVGPIANSMGGVGIAAPQDAITSVFANPATLGAVPFFPAPSFDFAGTLFMPKISAEIRTTNGTTTSSVKADSADAVYAIPAIGLNVPMGPDMPKWRFGLAAYGVSGLGVDYRGTSLDNASGYDFGGGAVAPLIQGEYTQLQIMKFSPAISYKASDALALGAALQIDYATLDLRHGTSPNYGVGVNLGLAYAPMDAVMLGLTYTTAQPVTHKRINDFNQDGKPEELKLESPQQAGIGAAYTIKAPIKTLIEADIKWLNWAGADGYKDFDWNNQLVYAIGAQVEPKENLFLRCGFNYGKNPLEKHNGFNGSFNPSTGMPNSAVNVQGNYLPAYYYETFRIIGFPAIVEKHLTLGTGYRFSKNFSMNLGYMHAFEQTISETGTDPFGRPVTIESKLSEDSLDFGLTWVF